jgi:peptidoglycan hydrolase-like protein with peptidoglycan-binding domain
VRPLRREQTEQPIVPPARRRLRRAPAHLPAAADAPRPPRRRRRRSLYATGAGALAVAVIVGVALLAGGTGKPAATPAAATHYGAVVRTNLVATQSFDGVVASQAGPQVVNRGNGTVTGMPTEGASITRGHTLYSVNGQPVVLMYGSVPAWRDIGGPRVTDGVDVQELEQNLAALGYNPGTVDQTFTSDTAAAIENWQTAVGLPADGVVHLGQVVFGPGALRIDTEQAAIGSPVHDGQVVMTTLSSTKVVDVSLDSNSQSTLTGGQAVAIVGANGTSIPATVTSVTAASSAGGGGGGGGGASQTAIVTPKSPTALSSLADGTAVTVNLVTDTRNNVLAVPVTALVAQSGGGYAVQVVRGNGTQFVPVTPGLYANDLVEVSGDLQEGDKVVTP